MLLKKLLRDEHRIKMLVKRDYTDTDKNAWPIYDGIVNHQQYVKTSPRIMWILKEPYDGGEAYEGGDWSLRKLLNKDSDGMSRKPTFQPICYIDHGVRSGKKWNEMEWLSKSKEIRDGLHNIAFTNISKVPGLKISPWGRIASAYDGHRCIILEQIKAYAPNIIFACDPHANQLLKEFGLTDKNWNHFGSAASASINANQGLVWVWHPTQRKVSRQKYVDDAVSAAIATIQSADAE